MNIHHDQAEHYRKLFLEHSTQPPLNELNTNELISILTLFGITISRETSKELIYKHDSRCKGALVFEDFLELLSDQERGMEKDGATARDAIVHFKRKFHQNEHIPMTKERLTSIFKSGGMGLADAEINHLMEELFATGDEDDGDVDLRLFSGFAWRSHVPTPLLCPQPLTRMLVVRIACASNLGVFASDQLLATGMHFNTLNPVVQVTTLGVSAQTAVLTSTLNPQWDEDLVLPISFKSARFQDVQRIIEKNYVVFNLYTVTNKGNRFEWLASSRMPLAYALATYHSEYNVMSLSSPTVPLNPAWHGSSAILEVSLAVQKAKASPVDHIISQEEHWNQHMEYSMIENLRNGLKSSSMQGDGQEALDNPRADPALPLSPGSPSVDLNDPFHLPLSGPGPMSPSSNSLVRVSVQPVGARNIRTTKDGSRRQPDPYVILRVKSNQFLTGRASVDSTTENGFMWQGEEEYGFTCKASDTLEIELMDHDRWGKGDQLGVVSIRIDSVAFNKKIDSWFPLRNVSMSQDKKKPGEIHLILQVSQHKHKDTLEEKKRTPFSSYYFSFFTRMKAISARRCLQVLGLDEYGNFHALPCFILPFKPSTEFLKSPRAICQNVARIPLTTPPIPFHTQAEFEELCQSPTSMLCNNVASAMERAILLCDLLLGIGLDAYVAIGLKQGVKRWWVITLSECTAKRKKSRQPLPGFDPKKFRFSFAQTATVSQSAVHYDPETGAVYEDGEVFESALSRVHVLFNNKNVWLNIQRNDSVDLAEWDLTRSDHWECFLTDEALEKYGPIECWYKPPKAIVRETRTEYPIGSSISEMEEHFFLQVKLIIDEYRRSQCGIPVTEYYRPISLVMKKALVDCERVINNEGPTSVNWKDTIDVGLVPTQPESARVLTDMQSVTPQGYLWSGQHYRFRALDLNRIMRCIGFTGILNCTEPEVTYTLTTRVFAYPWKRYSVWVAVGYLVKMQSFPKYKKRTLTASDDSETRARLTSKASFFQGGINL